MKNFEARWLDFILPTQLVTTSKLIKDVLKEEYLLWYNSVTTIEIHINDRNDGYLKFIKKLTNIQYVKIYGDIGMKKTRFLEKVMHVSPNITIELNQRIIICKDGEIVEQKTRIPEELYVYQDIVMLKDIDNFKNIRYQIRRRQ